MSGGSLNYFSYQLEEHAGDFDDKDLDELTSDLASLFHDREWYLSGDTGKGEWNEARDKFKEKWFAPHNREERVEKYLASAGGELREMLGFGRYCQHCENWTPEKDGARYGWCKHVKGCMMHRSESACDKFERRTK